MLLAIIPAIPLIASLFLLFKWGKVKNIPLLTSGLVLILGGFGLRDVFTGTSLTYKFSLPGPFTPTFHADSITAIFVILAAFLWLIVSIYAPKYMKQEGKASSFNLSALLTFSAVLGVLLAGDLFTMLLFFEIMTITSFFWVVHRWNKEAIRAGYFYLFFSIIGGLFLALAIVLMSVATGALPAIGSGQIIPLHPKMFSWSIALMVAGFGIKAGMVPLHLWLPHAHSVAPTPGSALLSGLLIKIGAYGLIRVGEFAGWGVELGHGATWLGPVVVVIGTCTMLVGVAAALLQSDAKRLLAYHSVSQMGYIILGLGIGLYMGPDGGLGLLGALYHIVNHALFKVALFLGVGIIYTYTGETNLYRLGGLWRRFPITALFMFLAVLGITGAPGLNGYASKTLLHHAVSQAAGGGPAWVAWIERLFLLVGVGTAASFTKLYYLMFLGRPAKIQVSSDKVYSKRAYGNKDSSSNKYPSMLLAMGLLIIVMVGIGLAPKVFLKVAGISASQGLGIQNAATIIGNLSFWNIADITGMFITLTLGILVCWVGLKSGIFSWQPPGWLTLEGLGRLAGVGISNLLQTGIRFHRYLVTAVSDAARSMGTRIYLSFRRFGKSRSGRIGGLTLTGISADAALLIMTLVILIVWYTLVNPDPPGIKLLSSLSCWMGK